MPQYAALRICLPSLRQTLGRQARIGYKCCRSDWHSVILHGAAGNRAWSRQNIGVDELVFHDLRHSFASPAIALGALLPTMGKLHAPSQVRNTARYAHLAQDTFRESASRLEDSIGEAAVPHSKGRDRMPARLRRIERGAKLPPTPNRRKRTARRRLLRNGDRMCAGTKEQNDE